MTFSCKVKNELCKKMESNDKDIKICQIYGALLFCRNFSYDKINLVTGNKMFCDILASDIAGTFLVSADIIKIKKGFLLSILSDSDRKSIINTLCEEKNPLGINSKILKNEKLLAAFLRGVFLSCGTISDPSKDYHLEFCVQNQDLAMELCEIISKIKELNISPKVLKRKESFIVYIKECESIIDFITYMGAGNNAMDMIQIKILKEVRNYVNRTTNFEAANLNKTAKAAAVQIDAIKKLKTAGKLNELPSDLYEIAQLRLKNPEMSLKELAQNLCTPISRSGVNHKINKILEISKEI